MASVDHFFRFANHKFPVCARFKLMIRLDLFQKFCFAAYNGQEQGLTRRKYSTKRGSLKTMDRYSSVATTAISSRRARHSGFGAFGGCMPCSRVAAVKRCSVLKHKCSSPKDCSMTSPWTVTRRDPWIVSGGWDKMASGTTTPSNCPTTSMEHCQLHTEVLSNLDELLLSFVQLPSC